MRRARSSAARTPGSSSTTSTVAAEDGLGAGSVIADIGGLRGAWTSRSPEADSGRRGRSGRTSRPDEETRKGCLKVSEERRRPRAPGTRGRRSALRGRAVLVGARAELDLDVARRAPAADLEGLGVAGIIAVDGGHEGVGPGDGLAVDRGDDVAGADAGVGGGRAADDLADLRAAVAVGELHAEVGVGDLAAGDQLLRDALHDARGDREADAVVAAGVALDLGIDADDVAVGVEQRAAGVAVVDRGVRLDRAVDREVVRGLDRAVERADDAGRDGALEAERAADGDDAGAHEDVVGVGELQRVQLGLRRVDLDHGDVGRGVGPDDLRAGLLAVGERDGDRVRAVDDVLVRGDVAVAVDHEAGALGLRLLAGAVAAAARPAEVVGRRAAAGG